VKLLAYTAAVAATTFAFSHSAAARDLPAGTTEIGGATAFIANAQISKVTDNESQKTTTSAFNVQARHYFKNDVAVHLGFSRTDTDTEFDGSNVGTTQHSLVPGIAFNTSLNESTSVVWHTGFLITGLRQSISDEETGDVSIDLQGKGVQLGLELQSLLTESAALTVGGRLNRYKLKHEDTDTRVRMTDRQFSIGISVYF